MVADKPYSVQGIDLKQFEEQYIKDLDAEVWRYNLDRLPSKIEDMSYYDALELRKSVSQNIETVLALLFSVLQSRYCVTGWLSLYHLEDLKNLIEKINTHQSFYNRFDLKSPSWEHIVSVLWPTFTDDRLQLFTKSLKHMADFLTSEVDGDEYNALKHGMRLQKKSLSCSFAPSNDPTKKPSEDQYIHLGSSKFGSSFIKFKKIGNCNFPKSINRLGNIHFSNWDLDLLQYLAVHTYSIGFNLVTHLKQFWKLTDQAKDGYFVTPELFEPKRNKSSGIPSASFNNINYDTSKFLQTKSDIVNTYIKNS